MFRLKLQLISNRHNLTDCLLEINYLVQDKVAQYQARKIERLDVEVSTFYSMLLLNIFISTTYQNLRGLSSIKCVFFALFSHELPVWNYKSVFI
ncbi:hypothetical protein SVI_4084 [Shewanella violacea DSS12]|uniref:Uncharacterized protein n=1 Tax=Shewanella violacea (strain JCM 10179 / CIP 106290 / LMG 19151 / DSS12) TaxID=637905 RepID=D4ZDZ4_SHEVD|nr:hypothetical protein SVI_4084 [Shewanella violacea DSS12]